MLHQIVRVNNINFDEIKTIQADEKTDWLAGILDELMEDLQGPHFEDAQRSILLNAELEKKEDINYRNILFLKGNVDVTYSAICGHTADLINQTLKIPLHSIILNKSVQIEHDLEDEISLFYDEHEWDLYFYEKNQVDLYTIIHEYIFLNKNPYPGPDA